tara:strand:+ start:59910 stop:60083 length:174 start_codon:yes stop_codon:yes gene_type:complete
MELRNWFKTFLVAALMITNVAVEKQFTQNESGEIVASWGFSVDYNDSYAVQNLEQNF